MVWILILHIIKQNKRFHSQNKCITKIKLKSKNRINLKQTKFYLPKKNIMEHGKNKTNEK